MTGEGLRPLIIRREAIASLLPSIDLVACMEAAFVAYSQGRAQVASVAELLFRRPPGEVHIKSGHISGEPLYTVKVASGFYENPALGLPSSSGLVLLFDAATGQARAILLDEGMLTDQRTAAAGAVCAKYLAPPNLERIGVVGGGIQARLQLAHLRAVTPCRRATVWARRPEAAEAMAAQAATLGFETEVASSAAEVAASARLIVTTTPASEPILYAANILPGTHITAVGADSPHKGELSDDLLGRADLLAADSLAQSRQRGEFRRASPGASIIELGDLIAASPHVARPASAITIADLTGVAVQDCAIAQAVLAALDFSEAG